MEDPIEDIIIFVKKWLNKIRLSFLNEDEIIGPGEPMVIRTDYGTLRMQFLPLESEPDLNKLARQYRAEAALRAAERSRRQVIRATQQLWAVLAANRRLKSPRNR
ncbi:hypothetical protein [Curtobacterium sp. MCSS17_007]|uniref:hypothetical protein n=1 Tax=Curtobacterium sp. MCSS17_007 TaxID=2175646 RepID=UPI000DA966B3|nr:hypothetical protein [Curtobacterium sp. MCSS17_007]WIE74517.1 hypothetical protein DEJ22_009500 [Curtobacterium sp. MCSS17_007]